MAEIQKPKLIQNLSLVIGGILLIAALFSYFRGRRQEKPNSSPLPEEIIVQEGGGVKKTNGEVKPMTDEELKQMKEETENVLDAGGEVIQLQNVAGDQAEGEAKRAFSDGRFYFKLTAVNLKGAGKGYYYEGWLQKNEDYLSCGRLEVDASGRGVLYYSASMNRLDYNQAIITLEPDDGNPAPATAVLKGSF